MLEVLKWGCLSFLGGQEESRRRGNSAVYSCNFPDPVEDRPSCVEHRIESLVFWSFYLSVEQLWCIIDFRQIKVCTFLPDDTRLCRAELSDQACGFYTGLRICLLVSAYNI